MFQAYFGSVFGTFYATAATVEAKLTHLAEESMTAGAEFNANLREGFFSLSVALRITEVGMNRWSRILASHFNFNKYIYIF